MICNTFNIIIICIFRYSIIGVILLVLQFVSSCEINWYTWEHHQRIEMWQSWMITTMQLDRHRWLIILNNPPKTFFFGWIKLRIILTSRWALTQALWKIHIIYVVYIHQYIFIFKTSKRKKKNKIVESECTFCISPLNFACDFGSCSNGNKVKLEPFCQHQKKSVLTIIWQFQFISGYSHILHQHAHIYTKSNHLFAASNIQFWNSLIEVSCVECMFNN